MSEQYIVLSRKYRPQCLDDLIGQEILAKSLKSCLDTKKVPHAFLFYGIRGVGKTTTARILARSLCCTGEDGKTDITSKPCGVCKSCKALNFDQHLDIMEFDAASRTGVDDIREIIDSCQYMPVLGRYKIYIIDEVHMLSKSAFNALLKTLEEPPSHVKFIFATTEIQKIPETILSRCMTFQLNPVSTVSLSAHLIEIAQAQGTKLQLLGAELIAKESEGSVRDALSILERAIMLCGETLEISNEIIVDMLCGAKASDIESLLNFILEADSHNALLKSQDLLQKGADPFAIYKGLQNLIYQKISDKVLKRGDVNQSLSNLLYLWQIFLNQTNNMTNSFFPEHVLNAAIVILAHTASFPNIENLIISNKKDPAKEITRPSVQNLSTPLSSKIEDIIGEKVVVKKDHSNKLVNNLLDKFPGSSATEIE